jgi:transposase
MLTSVRSVMCPVCGSVKVSVEDKEHRCYRCDVCRHVFCQRGYVQWWIQV